MAHSHRLRTAALACALLLALGAAPGRAAAPAPTPAASMKAAWGDEVIYLIMVDRFHNGDKASDRDVDRANPFAYHGGDLAGVTAKLDYMKDLGVTTIWLTPINDNQDTPLEGKYWPYHGYWIADFDRVDEHFGDTAALKRLVDAAHARGLKVLIDAVANHPGYDAPLVKDPARRDWFHRNGSITDWNDPYQNENFDLVGLPDFNTENKAVLGFMERAWAGWIDRVGVDGFRVDTVRHVPVAFWHRFSAAMHAKKPNFLMLAEVSYHDPAKLPRYHTEAGFDSLFDFPMFGTLVNVFAKGGSMRQLEARLRQDAVYPDAAMLSPFLDNHDETRFITAAGGDARKLKLGLACLLTMRGIPSLLYGTEVGLAGGRDPDNRRDMPFGASPELHTFTRQLLTLRRESVPLRRGEQRTIFADDAVLAFSRRAGSDEVVVVLNNADRPESRSLRVSRPGGWADGIRLVDRLSGKALSVKGGQLRVSLAPKQAMVVMPAR